MDNTRLSPGKALKSRSPLVGADFAPVASVPMGDRVFIGCCAAAIVALAWAYLFYLDHQMMQSMEVAAMPAQMEGMPMEGMAMEGMAMEGMPTVRAWTVADLLFTFVMWLVMMTGMMAASVTPVVLLFAGAHAKRGAASVRLMSLSFVLGYALMWACFSALATLAQWALHHAGLLSPMMAVSGSHIGAAVLLVAGVYQLTPLKRACLRHCRSPLGFLMTHWREGKLGALEMGMRHGAYCLGCCWALMLVLFVVGVMNLVWVAALALFVLLEKTGPAGILSSRVAGVAMIAAGVYFIAGA